MAELTVDMTYGQALLDAGRETGKAAQILEEAKEIVEILKNEPDLKAFISFPGISGEEKKSVLKEIFEGKICQELMNFLYILVDKRRANRLEGIMKVYSELYEREEGVSYGVIYSVTPLSPQQLEEIEEQTSKLLRFKVRLENDLDPKLIAGFKILVEGKIIDASYRKRFDEMASQIRAS